MCPHAVPGVCRDLVSVLVVSQEGRLPMPGVVSDIGQAISGLGASEVKGAFFDHFQKTRVTLSALILSDRVGF